MKGRIPWACLVLLAAAAPAAVLVGLRACRGPGPAEEAALLSKGPGLREGPRTRGPAEAGRAGEDPAPPRPLRGALRRTRRGGTGAAAASAAAPQSGPHDEESSGSRSRGAGPGAPAFEALPGPPVVHGEALFSHVSWASPHFRLDTPRSAAYARALLRFCEEEYRRFARWAGRGPDAALWPGRASVTMVERPGAWSRLAGRAAADPETGRRLRRRRGLWQARPPAVVLRSEPGAAAAADQRELFPFLQYLFLTSRVSGPAVHPAAWLLEGFARLREKEISGPAARGCLADEPFPASHPFRAWQDPGDWRALLEREVRKKADEELDLLAGRPAHRLSMPDAAKAALVITFLLRLPRGRTRFLAFADLCMRRPGPGGLERALREVYDATPLKLDRLWRRWIRCRGPARARLERGW